jgi:hypothetical protein
VRNLIPFLVCLQICGFVSARAPVKSDAAMARKTRRVVAEFFKVIGDSQVLDLAKRATPVERALQSRRITILIPPDDPGRPLHAAAFILDKENQPCLELKRSLIELYPKYKSYVFAVLMHEVSHANNYLWDPEAFVKRPKEDRLERYLYEMDAMYLEAQFIRDVSKPKGWKLSPFETYLLESLAKDDLASASTVFQSIDMDFVYTFYKARSGPEPLEVLGKRFVAAGRSMKEDFLRSEHAGEWERYRCLVSVRSFVTLGSQLAATLVNHKNPEVDPKDTIERHLPGFDAMILDLQDLLTEQKQVLGYRTRLLDRFNASFR